MAGEFLTMSAKELDRLEVVRQVVERQLPQAKAAELLGLTSRQVRRLCRAYERLGPGGLVSRRRGRPSNRRLPADLRERVIAIVRERYADFGPKLAREKLLELHDVHLGRETLRRWMAEAGIWLPRRERVRRAHQPRHRRSCLGELVQIDGCDHEWFEDRAPRCALLVYVDDATGNLMELCFVEAESAFDYFASTRTYLARHGRPVAFYSDKHSIFRVARRDSAAGRANGVTQFGRALAALNIDIICANTPQAKGRVERMNQTLQDRLVKELRLRGVSTMADGNAFLPAFMSDYNRRFGRPPRDPHDAHRPLGDQDLDHVFAWQEDRRMSGNLTVHFKRRAYLVTPTPATLALAGKIVRVYEWEDGRVELHCEGRVLPYSIFDKNPIVSQGAIVENKRLGAVLATIQTCQAERDRKRLALKHLSLREKERLRNERAHAGVPAPEGRPAHQDRTSLLGRKADISTWV